jgi:antitoxin component YwqK of YwqJK toxin-antitoxin module
MAMVMKMMCSSLLPIAVSKESKMKQTLLIITALMLVVGCSSPEPINIDELVKKGDIFYTKDTNKPYSGPVFSLYENGQKEGEATFKDGKFIESTRWDEDGYEY